MPVHLQGDSSESFQLLKTFLVSFKRVLISNKAEPKKKSTIFLAQEQHTMLQKP